MYTLSAISIISDTGEFVSEIFGSLGIMLEFFVKFLLNIPSYFKALVDFFYTFVIELPIYLMSMFDGLPIFAQTGLLVVLYAIYIAFIFRLIKLIVPLI